MISCQGIYSKKVGLWNPMDCRIEIQRLEFYCGFPNSNQLRSPAFTGDKKYEYILAGILFAIPFFKVSSIWRLNDNCVRCLFLYRRKDK